MKAKLYYGMILAVTVYVAVMYEGTFPYVFLAWEILLLVGMWIWRALEKRSLGLKLQAHTLAVEKGKEAAVSLEIENKGFLPAPRLQWQTEISYRQQENAKRQKGRGSVGAKGRSSQEIAFLAEHCGLCEIALKKARLWDPLGLFGTRFGSQDQVKVTVWPRLLPMLVEVSQRTRNFITEGDTYEEHKSGDDPSEIYQIREFREGDKLQRIHWKMSAKVDQWMTKEYSMPKGCRILVLFDLQRPEGNPLSLEQRDGFYELAYALILGLADTGFRYLAAWYDAEQGALHTMEVDDQEQGEELMARLLETPLCPKGEALEEQFQRQRQEMNFSTVLSLGMDLTLLANGEPAGSFSAGKIPEELEGFLLEV